MEQFDLYPAKKGRRVLITISDILITLIVSLFVFEIIVMQIDKPIIGYNDIQIEIYNLEVDRRDLLVEKNLLTKSEKDYDFSADLELTAENYIKFYTLENEEDKKYDVLYNYFVILENKDINYLNSLLIEKCPSYFDSEKTTVLGTYALKSQYKDYFTPNFTPGDEMSETAKGLYSTFKETDFLSLYQTIISNISLNENILDSKNHYFSYYTKEVGNHNDFIKKTYVICSYITYVFTSLILYLLIPLLNKKGRTVSEIILKVERINVSKMKHLKKKYVLLEFLINFLESLSIIVFIPSISLGIEGIFSFPLLYGASLVSLVFLLASLIILLVNQYAKSIKEFATNSLCVDTSSMDEYLRITSKI